MTTKTQDFFKATDALLEAYFHERDMRIKAATRGVLDEAVERLRVAKQGVAVALNEAVAEVAQTIPPWKPEPAAPSSTAAVQGLVAYDEGDHPLARDHEADLARDDHEADQGARG